MLFEETDTEESSNSRDGLSSLDDDLCSIRFESSSSGEQVTDDDAEDDDMHSEDWNEIESELDTEFTEDYGMMEELPGNSPDNTINPIDC